MRAFSFYGLANTGLAIEGKRGKESWPIGGRICTKSTAIVSAAIN